LRTKVQLNVATSQQEPSAVTPQGHPERIQAGADSRLLDVRDLDCTYWSPPGLLLTRRPSPAKPVVRGVSLSVAPGETLALVGESGSGKSTIVRAIAGLLVPTRGRLVFDGHDITLPVERRTKEIRRQIQLILQNPDASLNPRQRVVRIIGRPLEFFFRTSGREQRRVVAELLETVQLDAGYMWRLPSDLSGGERQRVAIARALAAKPKLLLCDEILSALDVSVQAGILNLLRALQARHGLAFLFITHDLVVVRTLAHRVAVLYQGEICEVGSVQEVFSPPFHPYTEVLLRTQPMPTRGESGHTDVQSGPELEEGGPAPACPFALQCPRKVGAICDHVPPPWGTPSATHAIRCHIPGGELAKLQAM
jgi:peptide/nickel transport system ATP-binding protein